MKRTIIGLAMAVNEWGNGYWLNANGTWTYQLRGSRHKNATGRYAKNTTIKIDGVNYTFNASGYWVK